MKSLPSQPTRPILQERAFSNSSHNTSSRGDPSTTQRSPTSMDFSLPRILSEILAIMQAGVFLLQAVQMMPKPSSVLITILFSSFFEFTSIGSRFSIVTMYFMSNRFFGLIIFFTSICIYGLWTVIQKHGYIKVVWLG